MSVRPASLRFPLLTFGHLLIEVSQEVVRRVAAIPYHPLGPQRGQGKQVQPDNRQHGNRM